MEIKEIIENFALNEKEAKVYLAALELGESTVLPISKKANVKRTHCYDILENLKNKGFANYYEKNKRRRYFAEDPTKIKLAFSVRLQQIENMLPELKSIYNKSNTKPKIKFYEGEKGLQEAQFDTLNIPAGSEILAYASSKGLYYNKFADKYISERVAKNIRVRAIVPNTKETQQITASDFSQLRESRLIPAQKFPFTNEIDIYGNKIAIISYSKELIAVIIESESIANTQRLIFELAWAGAKYFEEKN